MDEGRLARTARQVSLAAACVPVVLAAFGNLGGQAVRPVAEAVERPSLAFRQYLVDLGAVTPTQEVGAHFDFVNRGENIVHVQGFQASCGCLQPMLKKMSYLPGERGTFFVRVETANQPAGPREYRVKIRYHDPEPREADVVFRVELPEYKVFVEPRSLLVYSAGDNGPTTQKITVLDRRPEPLTITKVECTRPELAFVDVRATDKDEHGNTRIHLTAMFPADLPEGRTQAAILIYTQDPEYRVLRVPLKVQSERRRRDPELIQAGGTLESSTTEPEANGDDE